MPGRNHPSTSVQAARTRAAFAFLFLALGLLASWELPEVGFVISLAPFTLFLLSTFLAAFVLGIPVGKRGVWVRISASCLCLAVFAFGLAWGNVKLRGQVAAQLSSLIAQSKSLPTLRLTILHNPRTKPDGASWSCLAELRALVDDSGNTPINRNVWLSAKSDSPPRPGDRLIARATFRPVEPPRNPGEFDLRRWATDRNIAGSLHISSAALLRPDESPAGIFESAFNLYRRSLGSLRNRASSTVDALASRASPDAQQLLRGLLLGENPPSPSEGLASFYQLGLAHILSISGFHLMVFAAAALFSLRLFGDLGRLEPLVIAGAILLFLAIVPASSPLVRAATILLVLLAAECFGRRYDRLTLLCWTAVVILLFRPSELWSLGFQLSFGLTAALLTLAQRLSLRLFPPPLGVRPQNHWLWSRAGHALAALFVTGLLCWALSAPWIAANVGIFNPLSIVTGILLTPVIVLSLWIGYAALILGLAVPPFASLVAVPIGAFADFAVNIARWWDSIPAAVIRLPPLSQTWALAATVCLALWFVRGRLRILRFALLACILAVWAALEMMFAHRLPINVAARAYLLDERPANCTIIRTPDRTLMINAGTTSPASQGRDLVQVARHLGAWQLDTLILDARDPLSTSGAPAVLRTLRPTTLTIAGPVDPVPNHIQTVIAIASDLGIRVQFASTFSQAIEALPARLDASLPARNTSTPPGIAVLDFPQAPQ